METCCACGKRGDADVIRRCSRCKGVRYCSRDCQARDWPSHKVTCSPATRNPAYAPAAKSDVDTTAEPPTPRTTAKPKEQVNRNDAGTSNPPPATGATGNPWQRARSQALAAFPGNRVLDRFGDLSSTNFISLFSPTPSPYILGAGKTAGVAMVVRLVSRIFHPFRHMWTVEDSTGTSGHLALDIPGSPAPHFRYDDLQKGRFLCVKEAKVEMHFRDDVHFVTVKDASCVRVFRE